MEQKQLDRLASAGAEMPDGLGPADIWYFQAVRNLYQYAQRTDMPPEQGAREKAKIADRYHKLQVDEWNAMVGALRMRDTSGSRADYRKARNAMQSVTALYLPPDVVTALAAADRIVESLDNIPIERSVDAKPNNQRVDP